MNYFQLVVKSNNWSNKEMLHAKDKSIFHGIHLKILIPVKAENGKIDGHICNS